ncbi:MAG: flagellar motor switch protein FliM [Gammaproteobacteria bacterium]|nr:flagellar motor switch protein FliM [Gammaproteobacteria bacterium]
MPADNTSEKILEQDELDALLQSVQPSSTTSRPRSRHLAGDEDVIRSYDFAAPGRIISTYMPQLELINERFSRTFRPSLFNLLHQYADLSKGTINVYSFADYMSQLNAPMSINMVRIRPLRGTAMIVFEPQLIYAIVDSFFGGKGRPAKAQRPDFTPSEVRITQMLLEAALDALKQAWSYIQSLEFEFLYSETNPQFASIMAEGDSEVMVVSKFTVNMGDRSGEIHINMPYSMLEPLRARLSASIQNSDQEPDLRFKNSLKSGMHRVEVEVRCELEPVSIALEDLTRMRTGDVIPIANASHATLYVGDVPVHEGRAGTHRGHAAMQVDDCLLPGLINDL